MAKLRAIRSVIDPVSLQACLQADYDLGIWQECILWLRGLNDTYRVRTERGAYVLRLYRPEVGEADVRYEIELLNGLTDELANSDTRVAAPTARRDRSFHAVLEAPEGERIAVLFPFLEGAENALADEAACFAFGRSAAELHAAMDRVAPVMPRRPLDVGFLVESSLERIVGYIGERHAIAPYLRAYAEALVSRIETAVTDGLDFGICHGDMHGNNNAFESGGCYTHYDFEWAAPGWRAYDLAQVRARKRQSPETKDKLWAQVLAGYRSVRAFDKRDEEAVELFVLARRFWVMSLDVMFIPSDMGALDYGDEWLESFVKEFKEAGLVAEAAL
ncbi:phosphotransferase [Paenibacillus methanolicus]|uniref:Ser/Thr protein kinase RdoA (MazF antagonist) n=1 Tax=Paenibacillus methanolicus TaxID=582686 RepID=A0A5S5BRW0_9BACL|nr:phosphotransferase [Paenibacillus methanolicus]TYP69799.1 Ser/Thr protein kinase RdoA (MazF antagonist) [Paenibacillus methanolicus]